MTENASERAQRESIETALESIVQLELAGRHEEARTYLTGLWPYLLDGLEDPPDPHTTSVFSGASLGYLQLGARTKAIQFAENALIVSPSDSLAHAILPVTERILIVRKFMHHHQYGKARELLGAIRSRNPEAAAETDFYVRLLEHYASEAADLRALRPLNGDATLFNVVLWGEAYVDKFLRTSLPSLLAPGNVPALAERGPVVFDIYTTETDRERLAAASGIDALAGHARIDYTLIPPEFLAFEKTYSTGAPDRLFVSGSQYLSALKAKALAADFAFVVTEGLYSDRHFSVAKRYLRGGYKAVLMCSLRTRDADVAAYLKAQSALCGDAIVLDAKQLLDYTTGKFGPHGHDLFIRSDSRPIGQDVTALYFKTATGFAAHTYQISPALISHEIVPADLQFDYHTSDTRLLAELAKDQSPDSIFKVVENPARDDLFVTDLDSGPQSAARVFGSFPVTVDQCVTSALKWCSRQSDFGYFEWAFGRRFEFDCDPNVLPDNDKPESEIVAEFLSLFRDSRDEYARAIRYFREDDGGPA